MFGKLQYFVALLVLGHSLCSQGIASERVALVIGNSQYAHVPVLSNPENDARSIAKLLSDGGFSSVIHRNNVDRLALERAIDEFSELVENASIALFYYAGHGIQVEGKNYIVPVDASIQGRRDVGKLTTIDEVLHEVGLAQELGVVILDACRDNPFESAITRSIGAGASSRGLSRPGPVADNTLVAFATEANAVASDGIGEQLNSPYTTALLRHLAAPGDDIRKVFGRVRDDVVSATASEQRPFVYGSLGGGDYSLFPAVPGSQVAAADGQRPVQDSSEALELALWQSAKEGNTVAEYQAYLRRFPSGYFVESARDRLSRLQATVAGDRADDRAEAADLEGMSKLVIHTDPPDASITIVNIDEAYQPGMLLRSGEKYDIQVRREGYRQFRSFIRLKQNEHVLNVKLKAADRVAALATNERDRKDGEVFIKTSGVADDESGVADRSELRLKAIGNALELAVLQVSGTLLSTESATTDVSSSSTLLQAEDTITQLRQDSLFNSTVVTRTRGHARLVAIDREEMQDGVYTVVAEVAVSEQKLKAALRDAGVLWQQVGRPTIRVTTSGADSYLRDYLRNAFSQNGIDVTTDNTDTTAFGLDVQRKANAEKTQFGTFAAHCSLAYELRDLSVHVAVSADRFSAGPEPGFSKAEAVSNCDRKLTQRASESMVRSLLKELGSIARDGRQYSVELRRVDGASVTRITGLVKRIFRVAWVSGVSYRNGDLSMQVAFKGQPLEFAELLALTLSYENLNVSLNSIVESQLIFDFAG